MKFIKTAALAFVLFPFMTFSTFAQIPSDSIVIYDRAYDTDLIFDSDYDLQIRAAANEHTESIFYNFNGEWKDFQSQKVVEVFDSWPSITYIDSTGFTKLYRSQNGSLIPSDIRWSMSTEILIDGPDGDPDSENYLLLKFNKPLADANYSAILADLSDGFGHYLSVDGNTEKSNIAAAEWSPDTPDELMLYISGAANIPSPSQISFTLKDDVIKSQDGGVLSPEYLEISGTVWNMHYGE